MTLAGYWTPTREEYFQAIFTIKLHFSLWSRSKYECMEKSKPLQREKKECFFSTASLPYAPVSLISTPFLVLHTLHTKLTLINKNGSKPA